MIDYLSGKLDSKTIDSVVLDVHGAGYRINIPVSAFEKLPSLGGDLKLFIAESMSMYGGGGTTFYGFLTEESRDIFLMLKEEVPGAGAKKALDYLNKVEKSLPDFKRAVLTRDIGMLGGVFGFTKKTAEKLAMALKDKIANIAIEGKEKWAPETGHKGLSEAILGLIALGYKEPKAREAVEQAVGSKKDMRGVEEIIRKALQYL
jgi:holliday junction DNA helicase RuvA